jgi:hypothetical protein
MTMMKKRSIVNTYGLISLGLLASLSSLLALPLSSVIPLASVCALFFSSISSNNSLVARSFVIVFNSARLRVNHLNVCTQKDFITQKNRLSRQKKTREIHN